MASLLGGYIISQPGFLQLKTQACFSHSSVMFYLWWFIRLGWGWACQTQGLFVCVFFTHVCSLSSFPSMFDYCHWFQVCVINYHYQHHYLSCVQFSVCRPVYLVPTCFACLPACLPHGKQERGMKLRPLHHSWGWAELSGSWFGYISRHAPFSPAFIWTICLPWPICLTGNVTF